MGDDKFSYFFLKFNDTMWYVSDYDGLLEQINNSIPLHFIRLSIYIKVDDIEHNINIQSDGILVEADNSIHYDVYYDVLEKSELKVEGNTSFIHHIGNECITRKEIDFKINDTFGIELGSELRNLVCDIVPPFTALVNLNSRLTYVYQLCKHDPKKAKKFIEEYSSVCLPKFHKPITSEEFQIVHDYYIVSLTHEE